MKPYFTIIQFWPERRDPRPSLQLGRPVFLEMPTGEERVGSVHIERCKKEDAIYDTAERLVDFAVKAHILMFGIDRETAT